MQCCSWHSEQGNLESQQTSAAGVALAGGAGAASLPASLHAWWLTSFTLPALLARCWVAPGRPGPRNRRKGGGWLNSCDRPAVLADPTATVAVSRGGIGARASRCAPLSCPWGSPGLWAPCAAALSQRHIGMRSHRQNAMWGQRTAPLCCRRRSTAPAAAPPCAGWHCSCAAPRCYAPFLRPCNVWPPMWG